MLSGFARLSTVRYRFSRENGYTPTFENYPRMKSFMRRRDARYGSGWVSGGQFARAQSVTALRADGFDLYKLCLGSVGSG